MIAVIIAFLVGFLLGLFVKGGFTIKHETKYTYTDLTPQEPHNVPIRVEKDEETKVEDKPVLGFPDVFGKVGNYLSGVEEPLEDNNK